MKSSTWRSFTFDYYRQNEWSLKPYPVPALTLYAGEVLRGFADITCLGLFFLMNYWNILKDLLERLLRKGISRHATFPDSCLHLWKPTNAFYWNGWGKKKEEAYNAVSGFQIGPDGWMLASKLVKEMTSPSFRHLQWIFMSNFSFSSIKC